MEIKEIAECLDNIGLQYMATIGMDGKPKVRPVQYMVVHENKLWFCTNSQKDMYKELCKNPFVDICGSRLLENEINTTWIRMSARCIFEENQTVKKMVMEKSAIVKELYNNDWQHPLFKVFYLSEINGSLNNLGHVKGLEEKADFAKPVYFSF